MYKILNFETLITALCKHAATNLNGLLGYPNLQIYFFFSGKTALVKSYLFSNFNYYHLVLHLDSGKFADQIPDD